MMRGTYQFAGRKVIINSLYPAVHSLCANYRAEGFADFAFWMNQADIELEREKSAREAEAEGHPPYPYTDDHLETLAVYRKIAEKMPDYDRFLFHGSCVAVDECGYLFAAKSGTGKSTHARLWRELLGERAVMVNDDKPLIHVNSDGTAVAYGTPWDGKHHLSSNISVSLKAICMLERAEENSIREITKQEALPMLIQQTYRPADPGALVKTLALLGRLNVKIYRLRCNMDISAAELSYGVMKEEKI